MKTVKCIFVALLSICVFPSDINAEAAAGVGKSTGKTTTVAKDSSSAGSSQSSVYGSPATVYQPGYNTPGSFGIGVGGGQTQYTSSAYGSPNYISNNGGNVPVQQQYSAPGSFGGANGQYIQQQQQQQQGGFGFNTGNNFNGQTFSTSTVNSPSSVYQTSYVSRPAQVSAGYGSPGYVQSQGQPGFGFGGNSGSGSGFATAASFNGGNNFNYQNQRPQQQFQNSVNYISQSANQIASPGLSYGSPSNYVNNNNNNFVQQTVGGFSTGLNYNRFNGNNVNYQNQFQQNQGGYTGTGGNNFQSTNYQYNRPGFSAGSGSSGFTTGVGSGIGLSVGNVGYTSPGTNYVTGSSGSSSGVSGGYSK